MSMTNRQRTSDARMRSYCSCLASMDMTPVRPPPSDDHVRPGRSVSKTGVTTVCQNPRHSVEFRDSSRIDLSYRRVSTTAQDLTRQIDAMRAAGVAEETTSPTPTRGGPGTPSLFDGSPVGQARYLPTNLSISEIANELYVSSNTVKTHIRHLYEKLGTHRRGQAVTWACALGLFALAGRR
jgi:hypothetical protein